MAKNVVFESGDQLSIAVASGTVSGDPVLYGDRVGVALTDRRSDGTATVKFSGVWNLSVKGVDGAGNSAVADGDVLYYVAADTPKVSKKNTGTRAGIAMGAVTGGQTATIPVRIG